MPKVPPSKPSRLPVTTSPVTTLRRWAHRLRVSLVEREIIDHILDAGRDCRWTMYTGTNLAVEIGCLIEMHKDHVKRGLFSLEERGWISRGTNDVGQRYVQFTKEFIDACSLADDRWQVRRALGGVTWQKINGDESAADKLHELAKDMTHARYRDRVRAAAAEYIINVGNDRSPGDESPPRRGRIVTSQVTNRHLRLIEGVGKSGA